MEVRVATEHDVDGITAIAGREADEQTRAIEEALKPAMRTRTA